jgi:hypothetical protein
MLFDFLGIGILLVERDEVTPRNWVRVDCRTIFCDEIS